MKMEPIEGSETSAIRTKTPGNYPKENILEENKYLYIRGSSQKPLAKERCTSPWRYGRFIACRILHPMEVYTCTSIPLLCLRRSGGRKLVMPDIVNSLCVTGRVQWSNVSWDVQSWSFTRFPLSSGRSYIQMSCLLSCVWLPWGLTYLAEEREGGYKARERACF